MGNQQVKERRDYGRKIDWKNAERPSPPGKPYLVPEEGKLTDVITIRWSPPSTDGGAPIIGYLVEHRRTGSPHWLRATPNLVIGTELPLTGLEPGWRYQFRVSAENDVGQSEPGELSEPLTVTPQKWAACAPFFNLELQDTTGLENEKVEFKVQVIGIPPPKISWYKDGFEVFSSRRTKIVTENDQSIFIIHQAALEDEGEIKCTATNRAGHAVTKANLKLEAPPRIRLPRQYEDGLIFEKGELIRLKVTAAGRPKPNVLWYHNGELLQKGGRYEISDVGTGSTVKISDACRDDRGEYVIKGTNKIGEDITSFLVTVTDRPSPPGKVQVTTCDRTVTLSWSSPEDDGGCKIGSYIVEYFRIGWDIWLKGRNCRQLSTTLEELIEGSEYKFRVRAENPYGISDPSEESDVIFIADPKRGILKPRPRKETPELLTPKQTQKEPKRALEIEENDKPVNGDIKRRLLEEKARKLLDTPLSVLLPYENSNPEVVGNHRKRGAVSSSESISLSSDDANRPPPVPKRKNKGKRLTPSPVDSSSADSQRMTPSPINRNVDKPRLTPSPVDPDILSRQKLSPSPIRKTEERMNGTIQSFDPVIRKQDLKMNGHLKFDEQDPCGKDSPLLPRENDDSILHGSSELMLVIYPRDRSKSVELSAQQRSEIEISLAEDSIAPPMSLSAPELGGSELFQQPLMRDAISSSELLYERTMARLYQDSIDEEAQRKVKRRYSMDRKSVERRASLKEPLLERRLSFKDKNVEETKPAESHKPTLQEASSEKGSRTSIKKAAKEESQSMIPKSKSLAAQARERLTSVEREQLEFALLRERLSKKAEESKPKEVIVNHQQLSDTTTTSSSFEPEESDEEEYEDDEYLEEEDSYLDDNKEKEEMEDDDFELDDDTVRTKSSLPSSRIPVIQSLTLPKPIRIAPYAQQEEDTYHPRSMIPTKSTISKIEKPEEIKPNSESVKQLPEAVRQPSPTKPQAQETKKEEPTKTSKIPVLSEKKTKKASKLFKKFALKREKKVPEVTLTPVDPNLPPAVVPKPILKNKTLLKKEGSPKATLKPIMDHLTDKSISEEESENEVLGKKKKQVRIAEPNEEANLKKKEQKPVDQNARENQVLIYHYSDIVKEFGTNKKGSRLYLNYDELKAHAKPEEPEKRNLTSHAKETKIDGLTNKLPEKPKIAEPEKPKIIVTAPEDVKAAPQEGRLRWSMEYATDVVLFVIACWLYLFKNELYAIPVLCVMAYRQLKDMTVEKYEKIKNSISKRLPEKFKSKTKNEIGKL